MNSLISRATKSVLICLNCCLLVGACSKYVPVKGNVLFPGQAVEVANKSGRIRISFVSPLKRKYQWDGQEQVVKMIPRKEPFLGKIGIYNPGDYVGFGPPNRTRLVVQESVRDFADYDQAYAFLKETTAEVDFVYTSDGLAVGFFENPQRYEADIDLWQILIHGRKPRAIVGARNNSIRLLAVGAH